VKIMVKKKLKKIVKKWKRYHEISDVGPITRRYFIMNAFDGALTMLGVVIGAAISGNLGNSNIIISAGIAGSIAMGASGLSGAYMTEKAERTRKLKKLERAMLADMKDGLHEKSHHFATIYASLVDGVSPAVAAMTVISPFFLSNFGLISPNIAFWGCIILTLLVLTMLGIYLARISDESLIQYGLLMLVIGIITAFLCIVTSLLLGGELII
jgi:predicted membrane protein (TIGR00267 family)